MDTSAQIVAIILYLGFISFFVICYWKVFEKANQPGWGVLIPFYNLYLMLKIADKPGWWLILLLIPLVNIVFAIILSIAIAEKFGKSTGFGLGLAFLGFIFYPILAFGDAKYQEQMLNKAGMENILDA